MTVHLFVDGGFSRRLVRVAAVVNTPQRLLGVVRTRETRENEIWSTQRSELLALILGAMLAKKWPDTARQLWSDSLCALGAGQPHLSGWRPKANADLVRSLTDRLRALRVPTYHVYSHLKRRFGLPDFFPHELADALVKDGVAGEFQLSRGPVHPRCLLCLHFPCRDPHGLQEGAIDAYPEPCARREDWPAFVAVPAVERLRRPLEPLAPGAFHV